MIRRYLESLKDWPIETVVFTLLGAGNGAMLIAYILYTMGVL